MSVNTEPDPSLAQFTPKQDILYLDRQGVLRSEGRGVFFIGRLCRFFRQAFGNNVFDLNRIADHLLQQKQQGGKDEQSSQLRNKIHDTLMGRMTAVSQDEKTQKIFERLIHPISRSRIQEYKPSIDGFLEQKKTLPQGSTITIKKENGTIQISRGTIAVSIGEQNDLSTTQATAQGQWKLIQEAMEVVVQSVPLPPQQPFIPSQPPKKKEPTSQEEYAKEIGNLLSPIVQEDRQLWLETTDGPFVAWKTGTTISVQPWESFHASSTNGRISISPGQITFGSNPLERDILARLYAKTTEIHPAPFTSEQLKTQQFLLTQLQRYEEKIMQIYPKFDSGGLVGFMIRYREVPSPFPKSLTDLGVQQYKSSKTKTIRDVSFISRDRGFCKTRPNFLALPENWDEFCKKIEKSPFSDFSKQNL